MKSLVGVLMLILLGSGGLLGQEGKVNKKNTKAVKPETAALVWDKLEHNFGTIPHNVPAKVSFKLKNKSKQPLILTSVQASCGCTAPSYSQKPIAPGKTTVISATYNAQVKGPFSKTLHVSTNLSDEQITLRLTGTVE